MYKAFNLKLKPEDVSFRCTIKKYKEIGDALYSNNQKEVKKILSDYISRDGVIDGTKLINNCFPELNKDVFISHSHKDLDMVKAFAGWLKSVFGLNAFIDSCSWGYCDNLLREIDDQYCLNDDKKTYNYTKRNYSTSHVHLMLSTALTKMMDQTECVIFFNTPNSIVMANEIEKIKNNEKTESPWIYHELLMTSFLKPQTPERFIRESFSLRDSKLHISYDVAPYLNKLTSLSGSDLFEWECQCKKIKSNTVALDTLYKIKSQNNN